MFQLPILTHSLPFQYFNPRDTATIPKLLSQTGVYNNTANQQVDTAMKPFTVNAPLWSDGAKKMRWVVLPVGKKIPYKDVSDFFDYPDSTVFVKTFLLERTEGDTLSLVPWETRLMVKKNETDTTILKPKNWFGFSYKWNAAGTDASLVSIDDGFDTVFYYTPKGSAQSTYKKWRFPSQGNCALCHREDFNGEGQPIGRAILGFYPAQIKNLKSPENGKNQIEFLFGQGVFSGAIPNGLSMSRRFKGIDEEIPAGLSPQDRWKLMDTLSRSYLAANCSGCHGDRGIAGDALGHGGGDELNWDWFDFKARQELRGYGLGNFGLNDTTTSDSLDAPLNRERYLLYVQKAGLPWGANQIWDMALPPIELNAMQPKVVYRGYPSLSYGLYRQVIRGATWTDSASYWRYLKKSEVPRDQNRLGWIFTKPWGSPAWIQLLTNHGLNLDSILFSSNNARFGPDGYQMPPLATYLPDTSALKILGEWVKNYPDSLGTPLQMGNVQPKTYAIRDNKLLLPEKWREVKKVFMLDIKGHSTQLKPLGNRTFQIPATLPHGIYFFKAGANYFRVLYEP